MKDFDVLSYVGSIFPSLISFFFIVNFFGVYFYYMTLISQHFRDKETRNFNFFSLVKKSAYEKLTAIGCSLKSWVITKKQVEVNE